METHIVSSTKALLENSVETNLRINDICAQLGYSKSYLSKLFKEQTGETLANYATKAKINYSKKLIRDGNFNFTEISDRLSFDNPQYFSRVFKRVTGMTPSEFKWSLNFDN
jgi:two-component system response regulator YesN